MSRAEGGTGDALPTIEQVRKLLADAQQHAPGALADLETWNQYALRIQHFANSRNEGQTKAYQAGHSIAHLPPSAEANVQRYGELLRIVKNDPVKILLAEYIERGYTEAQAQEFVTAQLQPAFIVFGKDLRRAIDRAKRGVRERSKKQ